MLNVRVSITFTNVGALRLSDMLRFDDTTTSSKAISSVVSTKFMVCFVFFSTSMVCFSAWYPVARASIVCLPSGRSSKW